MGASASFSPPIIEDWAKRHQLTGRHGGSSRVRVRCPSRQRNRQVAAPMARSPTPALHAPDGAGGVGVALAGVVNPSCLLARAVNSLPLRGTLTAPASFALIDGTRSFPYHFSNALQKRR